MFIELSPRRKRACRGRDRGLTRKGLNSKGLTRKIPTPVITPFACSNFLCYSVVVMQAQPLPHEEELSIVSNLSFVKRGYFEFFWEVFWSETRTEGNILLDFLFQEGDIYVKLFKLS